jgi:2-polyprenyl-3-methyl-5-hydroxy-6-metoxy-1,4-benzoquinol methylase
VTEAPHAERFLPEQMRGELIEAEHLVRYLWASTYIEGREVLDAGCGAGYGTRILLEHGAKRCVGVDLSPEAVEGAAERYGSGQAIEFETVDIADLPFDDDSFDAVVCFETLEHVEDQAGVLEELERVLRADGLLLLSSPNRGQYPPGNPYHTKELAEQEFLGLLSQRFAHVLPFRQHNWLASAILSDAELANVEADRPLEASLHKAAGRQAGTELYTLAICSHEPTPEPSQRVMMTHPLEVRRWLEQIEDARGQLARKADELRRTTEALGAAQRELVEVRDKTSRIIARAESRTYWLDRANIDLDRLVQRPWVRFAYRALQLLRRVKSRLVRMRT